MDQIYYSMPDGFDPEKDDAEELTVYRFSPVSDEEYLYIFYLDDPQELTPIRKGEEDVLLFLFRAGDEYARDRLLMAAAPVVASVVRSYDGRGLFRTGTLIRLANRGRLAAIEHFDPAKGIPFAEYSSWWIRQAILDEWIKSVLSFRRALRQAPALEAEEDARLGLRAPTEEEFLRGIAVLTPHEAELLRLRYFPEDGIRRSRLQYAAEHSIPCERVLRIEQRALHKLRSASPASGGS